MRGLSNSRSFRSAQGFRQTKTCGAQIILALDVDTIEEAKRFLDSLYPKISIFKVGSQLFTAYGPKIIEMLHQKGAQVFLDLKYFDIPNTVAKAVAAAVRQRVKMLTLHISGGKEMLEAAVSSAREQAKVSKVTRPLLIGVTVLTSNNAKTEEILALAKMGINCGLDGVVCSALETKKVREEFGDEFIIVTPGIRPKGYSANDQKRVTTAKEAIDAGANYIVVGRPILDAKDPLKAIKDLLD
ncbi:MAG: orotidine-5'-phosphate decarboxylase [Candidatus Omnitrophota bacterium]|jgi:orotidine-5'-phosphate decarboxylase